MEKEVLVWRIYPKASGTNYYQEDLENPLILEEVFDYCQILEATIFESGWQFLLDRYGFSGLFAINQKSGWFDAEDIKEFEQSLQEYWFQLQYSIHERDNKK